MRKLNERTVDMPVREIASLTHVIESVTANISAVGQHKDQENREGRRRWRNK